MFAVSDCFQVKLTKLSTEYDYYYQLLNTGQLNKIEMFMTCTYKLGSDFTKLALLFIFSAFVLCFTNEHKTHSKGSCHRVAGSDLRSQKAKAYTGISPVIKALSSVDIPRWKFLS